MNVSELIRRRRDQPLSEADYELAKKEILNSLSAISEFSEVDEFTKEERIARAATDDIYFLRTYLPHYAKTKEQAEFHPEIFASMDLRETPIALTAFRGGAKSTVIMAKELKWLLYNQREFIVHCLDTLDKAEMYTLALLTELQSNKRIIADFGLIVAKQAARGNFQTFDPVTFETRTRVLAFSIEMDARGLRDGNTRPDAIICEDLQGNESSQSEARTKKIIRKVVQDFRFALCAHNWFLMVAGNVIRSGSVIDQFLKKAKTWKRMIFPAERRDAGGRRVATWPEIKSIADLDRDRADTEVGGENVYRAEMLCEAVEMDGTFKESWFLHHDNSIYPGLNLKNLWMQVDPSFSDIGDNKAMVIGPTWKLKKDDPHFAQCKDANGNQLKENLYYVALDVVNRQCSIDEAIEIMYRWNDRWNPVEIRVDGSYAQKVIFKREFARVAAIKGKELPIKFTNMDDNKKRKIAALEPIVEQGCLLLPPRNSDDVNETVLQFTRFNESNKIKDDGPDVIAEWIKTLKRKGDDGRKTTAEVW